MSEIAQRTAKAECDKHGEYEARYFRIGENWRGGYCPKCSEEEERERADREAEERQQQELARLLRIAYIPKRFADATLANYHPQTDQAKRVHDACRRYVETFPGRAEKGCSLIFSGDVGTGKTHLACAIAKAVIQKHRGRVLYLTVMQAVRRIRSTYSAGSEETEATALDRICSPDLLILDEAGIQLGSNHEHTVLFEIINRRYQDMRPTIVVSNLGLKELCDAIGERLVDRLRENGAVLTFGWDSYRKAS